MTNQSLKRARLNALKNLPSLIFSVGYEQMKAINKIKAIYSDDFLNNAVESMNQFFNSLKDGLKRVEFKLLSSESDEDIKTAINCLISLNNELQEARKFIKSLANEEKNLSFG